MERQNRRRGSALPQNTHGSALYMRPGSVGFGPAQPKTPHPAAVEFTKRHTSPTGSTNKNHTMPEMECQVIVATWLTGKTSPAQWALNAYVVRAMGAGIFPEKGDGTSTGGSADPVPNGEWMRSIRISYSYRYL